MIGQKTTSATALRIWGPAVLAVLLGWSSGSRADAVVEADCWNYDFSSTKSGHSGGIGKKTAQCPMVRIVGGIFPKSASTTTFAFANAVPGTAAEAPAIFAHAGSNTDLTTALDADFFGGEALAFARVNTFVLPDGRNLDGGKVTGGYVTASVRFDWRLTLNDLSGLDQSYTFSEASLKYSATVGNKKVVSLDESLLVFVDDISASGTVQEIKIPWVSGEYLSISMEATAFAKGVLTSDGKVRAASVFDNSMHWLGFSDVTDELGNPVASFRAISSDGTYDWANNVAVSVPEPGTYAMTLAGMCVLLLAARRRGRSAQAA